MLDAYIDKIGIGLLLAVWLFACIKGGPAERWGANLLAVNWIVTVALAGLASRDTIEVVTMTSDFLMSIAFLVIAIAYSSRWLGVAMFLQAIALALHAEAQFQTHMNLRQHIIALNLVYMGLLAAMACATAATWWRNRRARAKTAAAPPPPGLATPA